MSINVGDVVQLRTSKVSTKGGKTTELDGGLVGRVCRITGFGFCCVQFKGAGCRRIHRDKLAKVDAQGPACSAECTSGC